MTPPSQHVAASPPDSGPPTAQPAGHPPSTQHGTERRREQEIH
ncbi:hypothetical protein [[Mycobacterium] wendilense]|uniref:Uncharacterized protein n=1 Tax=[Mycobacterium] wendilense TaxID=3064284 RepID=A0ABM9MBL5_9MYCO|nr:hypothetical protein [Mycolicibacterium sp. MU0050]CAJ1581209.1 hypothetical protein MU0050_001441 [Mycolicibacterium sp. MU0050]